MGPSVFAGLGVMILLIPVNAIIAAISRKLQVKWGGNWMAKTNIMCSGQTNGAERSSYSIDE